MKSVLKLRLVFNKQCHYGDRHFTITFILTDFSHETILVPHQKLLKGESKGEASFSNLDRFKHPSASELFTDIYAIESILRKDTVWFDTSYVAWVGIVQDDY